MLSYIHLIIFGSNSSASGSVSSNSFILLESGNHILLETSGAALMEA